MKGTVTLNEAQKLKKQIYAKCIAKNMKTLQAAIMLGVTQRTVQLNINRYKALGDKIFIHGNTGKIHHDENIEQRKKIVTDIFLNTRIDGENPFENVTYALFTRLLHEIYNIACSKGWVRKLLRAIGYISPKLRKPAKICEHLYREKKNMPVNSFRLTVRRMIGSVTDINIVFNLFLTMQPEFPSACI